MWMAARRATSGVPGRFQAAVEMLVEMVEDQSKAIVHGDRSFIAPLALTVFVWVAPDELDGLPAGRPVPPRCSAGWACRRRSRIIAWSRPPT